MQYLASILKFGWPYLRRYWVRFAAGILLGVAFGISNLGFVWAGKTIVSRMDAQQMGALLGQSARKDSKPIVAGSFSQRLEKLKVDLERSADQLVDPWLPRTGRAVDWRQTLGGVLLLPLLVAARGYIGFLSSYCMGWVSERVVNDLRADVLLKLNSLSLDYFNRAKMGDLLARVNSDTSMLHRSLDTGLSMLIKEPVTIVGTFVMLIVLDWRLSLFVFLFLPVCMVPLIVLGRKARKAGLAGVQATVTQSSLLIEALSGIRVVKAFGLEARQVARFREISRDIIRAAMKNLQARELVNPAIETVAMLGLGGLVVFIFQSGARVDDLAGFLIGLVLIFNPIKKLAALHVLFQQTSAGVQRLLTLFTEQPSVRDVAQPERLKGFTQGIELRGVGFSYGGKPVLQDIQLTIPRGCRLGIAGESGGGKSTLINLLFRFYDVTEGSILIDGHDLRAVALRDLQRQMALVSQEIVLFDMTVAENIACGKDGATREEIEAAAKGANAHEFILQLPQGYETRIGERGVTLSGGQRQRLAIARAFVRDAPILLLDEATASLDSASEAEVEAAIDRLEHNRTVVCVAHRLATLANMDKILVMANGLVVESGNYEELLHRGGAFAEMARKQGIGSNRSFAQASLPAASTP